ncbi:uncharacterized protein M6B38_390380 [Iris pallida]|uniref:Clp R domain-containing protein n=1 Tax=Iris pallida TaxID=29817 RepID=A0AAX6G0I1_IRIPA|nr:uncharacterized protein M6B38_390380 [Iris pallida]
MPTPVGTARQCLAADAGAALDDAVSVARRRSHAQTTSLHVVFALLSASSSSLLRDALSRIRGSPYSPRLQFKALELCFSVALDRLPSAAPPAAAEEPPVSNSLMAAVKRSQANQRRHPDTFHFYQQQQMLMSSSSSSAASTSSFSGVKVELQQLVLAILDDPVVSRVFNEAGYCSPDIKLAVLRPPPPILRFPRSARCPPLFLCNFSPSPEDLGCSADADNCRRIGEILARPAARNPMLVGVGAAAAAADFARSIEQRSWTLLPPEISGIRYVSVEGGRRIENGLEDLARDAEKPGVLVGVGDLKGLVELGDENVNRLVSEMTRVLEAYKGRVWVMGWSATYETYMKFLSRYPMLDRDWDLQLLPITSQKGTVGAAAGLGGGGGLLTRPQRSALYSSFDFAFHYSNEFVVSSDIVNSLRLINCLLFVYVNQ